MVPCQPWCQPRRVIVDVGPKREQVESLGGLQKKVLGKGSHQRRRR